jgi:hypothetical protein
MLNKNPIKQSMSLGLNKIAADTKLTVVAFIL